MLWQVHISNHFLETMDIMSFGRKRKKTIQSVTSEKFKDQHLWTYVCVSAHGMRTGTSVKAPLMLGGKVRLYSKTCHQMTSYSGMSLLIPARQCEVTFCMCYRSLALYWKSGASRLAAVHTWFLLKNVCWIMEHKIRLIFTTIGRKAFANNCLFLFCLVSF